MISSPCMNCKSKDLPKNVCMPNCRIIKEVQDHDHHLNNRLSTYHPEDIVQENGIYLRYPGTYYACRFSQNVSITSY